MRLHVQGQHAHVVGTVAVATVLTVSVVGFGVSAMAEPVSAAVAPVAATSLVTTQVGLSQANIARTVEPVMLLAEKGVKKKDARGEAFLKVSATGSNNLPEAARRAYQTAARTLARTKPGCRLPWTLLAGIGRVESDHGRYGGSQLGTDGVARPKIIGIPLNGVGPVAAIRDTDNGRLDGDKVWDRAVGPMQFIPSTWAVVGADGDGDGKRDPFDIDDAALAAGKYLCHGGFSVADSAGAARAVFSYNHSDYYVALVLAFERGYRTGIFELPPPPDPESEQDPDNTGNAGDKDKKGKKKDKKDAKRGDKLGKPDKPGPSKHPKPDKPDKSPKPPGAGEPSPSEPTPSSEPTDPPSDEA